MSTRFPVARPETEGTSETSNRFLPLQAGDRLTQAEFLRRYRSTPELTHAELIEGVVYMPSPVSANEHGEPHCDLVTWLGVYRAQTPGVRAGDNSTLKFDVDNCPQPDGYLRLLQECGGQSELIEGYIHGAPELVIEITASSASYDLHDKLNAYRRNEVREYVVWRVWDRAVDWFVLRGGRFERHAAGEDGVFRSGIFPGLWLDAQAVVDENLGQVLQVLNDGLADDAHRTFAEQNERAIANRQAESSECES